MKEKLHCPLRIHYYKNFSIHAVSDNNVTPILQKFAEATMLVILMKNIYSCNSTQIFKPLELRHWKADISVSVFSLSRFTPHLSRPLNSEHSFDQLYKRIRLAKLSFTLNDHQCNFKGNQYFFQNHYIFGLRESSSGGTPPENILLNCLYISTL
jgi:hypothetical protein